MKGIFASPPEKVYSTASAGGLRIGTSRAVTVPPPRSGLCTAWSPPRPWPSPNKTSRPTETARARASQTSPKHPLHQYGNTSTVCEVWEHLHESAGACRCRHHCCPTSQHAGRPLPPRLCPPVSTGIDGGLRGSPALQPHTPPPKGPPPRGVPLRDVGAHPLMSGIDRHRDPNRRWRVRSPQGGGDP
jgi:hypothetical protein